MSSPERAADPDAPIDKMERVYCALATSPPDALQTGLQGCLGQHPEQAPELWRILVEVLERDFMRWAQVLALVTASERRGEGA